MIRKIPGLGAFLRFSALSASRPRNFGIAFFRLLTGKSSSYELGGTMVFDTPFGKLDIPFTRTGETVFKQD